MLLRWDLLGAGKRTFKQLRSSLSTGQNGGRKRQERYSPNTGWWWIIKTKNMNAPLIEPTHMRVLCQKNNQRSWNQNQKTKKNQKREKREWSNGNNSEKKSNSFHNEWNFLLLTRFFLVEYILFLIKSILFVWVLESFALF